MKIKFTEIEIFKKAIKKQKIAQGDIKELKNELRENPEKGDVIKNSGGLRKIRMAIENTGKSGGARIIYLYLALEEEIFLITAYKKSNKEDLTEADLKIFKKFVKAIKAGGLK
jgi:hypothetical protein